MKADPHRFLWLATLILLLAAALRIGGIKAVPPGLSQDEVVNGDIVQNIRQSQHALFFREGFGHEPLYHYFSVPFQVMLGDNLISIRLPAIVLGMLLMAALMRWLRRDFGMTVALAAGLLAAISWWPIIFSRIGIRPILTPLLLVGMAWFWRRPLVAGAFLGLTIYTYSPARLYPLIPILLLLLEWKWPSRNGLNHRQLLSLAGLAILLALPLAYTLWSDPSLLERVNQISGPVDALVAGNPLPLLESSLGTLGVFGISGDPRWTYGVPGLPLFDLFNSLLFVTGLWIAWRGRSNQSYRLLLVWLLVSLLPSALTDDAPSSIRIIGAVPVAFLLPALAWTRIWQYIRQVPDVRDSLQSREAVYRAARIGGFGLLLLPFLLAAGRTAYWGLWAWPQAFETRERYQSAYLHIAEYLRLDPELLGQISVNDGRADMVDSDSVDRNLGAASHARWTQSGMAMVWPAAEDTALIAPEYAPPEATMLEAIGASVVPSYRSQTEPSFAVWDVPLPTIDIPENVQFGNAITLLGVTSTEDTEADVLQISTIWRVEGTMPADLAIFIHVLGNSGELLAQYDGLDVLVPTLKPGDLFLQVHRIPAEEEPDRIRIGLYQLGNGLRLQPDGTAESYIEIPW